MGRGKRRKRIRQISSSDSDSNTSLKISKKNIPAPPAISFKKVTCNSQNCDIDLNLNTSKQLKRIPAFTAIKLTENKKPQEETMTIKKKGLSFKQFSGNQMELKETIKEVRETTAFKIKKPESSVPLSKTIKSPLKSVSSSISSSSSNSNSFIRSFVNCNRDVIQRDMTSPWKMQSLQDKIPEDCSSTLDDFNAYTHTQDLILRESINRESSEDAMQYSSSGSKCNDPSKLSSSCQRTLFKKQLHNKNIGNVIFLYKCKMHNCFGYLYYCNFSTSYRGNIISAGNKTL